MKQKGSLDGRAQLGHARTHCMRVKKKEPHQLWVKTVEKGAAREKLQTAAYQTQQEQIRVPQGEKGSTDGVLEEKGCSLRFLQYLFFSVLLNL